MALTFEWSTRKAADNLANHGVSFDEALTVFADPLGRIENDDRHSVSETRFVLLGRSSSDRLLAVMFTDRGASEFGSSAPARRRAPSADNMKKPARKKRQARPRRVADDEIRPEYDFSKARANPYAARFQAGVTVVALDADVAESFPDAAAVNDALRALAKIANRPARKSRSKRRTA